MGAKKCDLFINGKVVVKVKNIQGLSPPNKDQLRSYMHGLTISHGVLLNFPKPNQAQAPQAEHHQKWKASPEVVTWIIRELKPSA